MKRIFTLIVLLGIVMSAALTGCEPQQGNKETPAASTNAAPAAPAAPETPSTNK